MPIIFFVSFPLIHKSAYQKKKDPCVLFLPDTIHCSCETQFTRKVDETFVMPSECATMNPFFFFGKLTYVLKENDTKNIMGIPKIYNVDRNENQQMATG